MFRPAVILLALVVAITSGCAPVDGASAIQRDCAAPTEVVHEVPVDPPLRRYFFLIDRSSSYATYLPEALRLVEGTIDALGAPNAAFHVSWIGSNSGAPSEAVIPALGDLPPRAPVVAISGITPRPEYSEIEIPDGASDALRFQRLRERERARGAYNCDLAEWISATNRAVESWTREQALATERFRLDLRQVVAELDPRIDNVATHIYEAVFDASLTIQTLDGDRKTIVIFSDMDEFRGTQLQEGQLDLSGISVVIALMPYDTPADLDKKAEHWRAFFTAHGAESVTVLATGSTSAEGIARAAR